MSHFKVLLSFLACVLLLPSIDAVAQATASPTMPDLESAGALGEELFAQSGSVGMVLLVVRDNQAFFRGYGETAPGSHQLPTQDSVLRLCSLTKIFTTDVFAKLVADKTVQLDDPLQRFAPRVVMPKRVRPMRLVDLATHTSGLPRELGNAPKGTPHFTFPDYRTRWKWLPNQKLHSEPGKVAVYSNVAFDLLSDGLEKAAHMPYAKLLAERTLNPLGMRNTTYFPTAKQCSLLLAAADDQGPCTVTEETEGSSGLYSNATDMTIWLKYLSRSGTPDVPMQDESAQAIYLKPADLVSQKGLDHAGMPTGVGLGWIHILPVDDESHIVEKTGGGAGYRTYIAISHARHTAIFFAATDGPVPTHINLYNAANKLLLAIAGLPPLPEPPPKPVKPVVRHKRRVRTSASAKR